MFRIPVSGNVVCSFQPKSTSTVVIGKTVSNVEEQENVAAKNEDTEEEWVEQKTDLKKLPPAVQASYWGELALQPCDRLFRPPC